MGDLQTEVEKANVVPHLIQHLTQIHQIYGTHAFNFFIHEQESSNISGRMFYKVSGRSGNLPVVELNLNKHIKISDQLVKEFQSKLGKAKDYNGCFDQLVTQLAQQEDFKRLLSDFEKDHPGESTKLRNFILGQAAYVITENIMRKAYEDLPAVKSYTKLNKELEGMQKMLKLYQQDPKKNKDIIKKIEKAKAETKAQIDKITPQYAQAGRDLNKNLTAARQIAKDYKMPEQSVKLAASRGRP